MGLPECSWVAWPQLAYEPGELSQRLLRGQQVLLFQCPSAVLEVSRAQLCTAAENVQGFCKSGFSVPRKKMRQALRALVKSTG